MVTGSCEDFKKVGTFCFLKKYIIVRINIIVTETYKSINWWILNLSLWPNKSVNAKIYEWSNLKKTLKNIYIKI